MMTNVVVLAAISFLQALQILIVVAAVCSFIPIHTPDFVQKLFPFYLNDVRPEREMTFYRLWIIAAIGLQAGWCWALRKKIEQKDLWRQFLPYLCITAGFVLIQIFAVFKFLVFAGAGWAKAFFFIVLALSVTVQIFWPEVKAAIPRFLRFIQRIGTCPAFVSYGLFAVLLWILVWPDVTAVAARMFVRDNFYHLDSLIMSPGWAHLNGLLLNLDVTSQYSLAIPVIVAGLLNIFGGFDYFNVIALIIGVCMAYYFCLFVFIQRWLGSKALSAAATLVFVKLQLFHWGVAPLVWQYPSATAFRHWPDILFFLCLITHIRKGQALWSYCAWAIVGLSIVWMTDVGVYLLAAMVLYRAASFVIAKSNPVSIARTIVKEVVCVFVLAVTLMLCLQPQTVFNLEFWNNQFEFAALFLQGWGALPMTEGLLDKQFLAFCMGFVIPVVYLATLLYGLFQLLVYKRGKEILLLIAVSVYGLGLYHYFIHRSGVNSYYAVAMPFVVIVFFWVSRILGALPQRYNGLRLVLPVAAIALLMTTYLATYYPNLVRLSRLDFGPEKQYFKTNFDFDTDARLIIKYTKPQERVALISSFETKILMQANRPPLFYYFPLIESAQMTTGDVRNTYLHTHARIKKTIGQLDTRRPMYIFIEEKLLGVQGQEGMSALTKYIKDYYQLVDKGQYVAAFKRKI